jgi:hypothetical protein
VGSGDRAVEGAPNQEGGGVNKIDMDEFLLKPEHLKTLKPKIASAEQSPRQPKTPRGIKRKDAFAIVPLWWAEQAAKADRNVNLLVCVNLVYRAWRAKGRAGEKTFAMPNSRGVDRRTKIHTLRTLEKAGLITVEWRDRKSPIVTLTVFIF